MGKLEWFCLIITIYISVTISICVSTVLDSKNFKMAFNSESYFDNEYHNFLESEHECKIDGKSTTQKWGKILVNKLNGDHTLKVIYFERPKLRNNISMIFFPCYFLVKSVPIFGIPHAS